MLRRLVAAYRSAFSGLPREVWVLALASLVNRSGTMVLPFMSLYLTRKLGFSVGEAGRVLSLYGIGAVAGAYAGGWLCDHWGAVRVQQASLVGTGVGFVVLGRVHGGLGISLAVLGLSLVAGGFQPAMFTAVAQRSEPKVRTRSLALIRLAVNLGMSLGPAVGGFLAVRHYGWLFAVDAVTCWLAAALLVATLPAGAPSIPARRDGPGETVGSPWHDRPFLLFLGLAVVLGTVFFQIMSTMTLYFRGAYGFPEDTIGVLLALNTVMIVAFEMVLVRWLERRDHLTVAALGSLLVCTGLALLPLGRGRMFAGLTIVVWTVGEMLAVPMVNSFAASRAPAVSSGRYLGAYSLAFSVAFVIAPVAGTAVYERLGPTVLWSGIAVVGVLLSLGFLALARSLRGGRPTRAFDELACSP